MAIVLTQPAAAPDTGEFTALTGGDITSGGTETLDVVESTTSKTVKWIIEITDVINQKVNSYEILAANRFNNETSFNRSGIIGERISHLVDVVINGTDMELRITNNELVNISYKVARLEVV